MTRTTYVLSFPNSSINRIEYSIWNYKFCVICLIKLLIIYFILSSLFAIIMKCHIEWTFVPKQILPSFGNLMIWWYFFLNIFFVYTFFIRFCIFIHLTLRRLSIDGLVFFSFHFSSSLLYLIVYCKILFFNLVIVWKLLLFF